VILTALVPSLGILELSPQLGSFSGVLLWCHPLSGLGAIGLKRLVPVRSII
jgi:hypothetical protein